MSALDEDTANALRESGFDPEQYVPAAGPGPAPEPETDAPFLPRDVQSMGYSYQQLDYAARQKSPAEQMDLYLRMNDIRRMADVAKNSSRMSDEELEATAMRLDMPPNMVAMMQSEFPDDLERRTLYARMVEVAGPDSYFAMRFSKDPAYAAVMRGHEMQLANIQAALANVYATNTEIVTGWGVNAARTMGAETVFGIPAGLSQAARDMRNRPWTPQEELPIPEGLEQTDPGAFMELQGMNLKIREQNALRAELEADPATQAQAAALDESLSGIDDWLQTQYQDAKARSYAGQTETGNWWIDSVARPLVEGSPSIGVAASESAISPLLPLVHFGLLAQTSSYREMREEGIDPGIALPMSIARGLFEGYIEKLSMQNILGGPGLRSLLRRATGPSVTLRSRAARVLGHAVKSGAGEAFEEVLQGTAELTTTPLARAIEFGDPYANVFSSIYEGGGDLAKQGWGGFALGALTGGLLGNSRRELSDMRKYNSFQKAVKPLVAAGDAAVKNGKSVAEVRSEARSMTHALVADGADMGTTVYADPGDIESYLQGKPREAAERALASIGVTPEAFRQAQTDMTDIEIPIENLAVQDGGADFELVKLFRPTPNMETAAAIAMKTREAASVFDLARELQKEIDADTEGKVVPEAIRTLRQDLKTRLDYKAQEADFTASMVWAWARTQAERRGIDLDHFLAASGNIRAAMDAWINRNAAWLQGVRAKNESPAPETQIEEIADETPTAFDPAMGAGPVDIQERQGDWSGGVSGTEPGTAAQPVDTGGGGAVGPAVEPPAAEPQRTLFSPPPRTARPGEYADKLTGLPFAMETVSTEKVRTDPGAFQFKRDADAETGVKKGQEIPGDVNPAALGTMVLYEDVDGERFVVSGHHRLDLLRRKGEDAEVRAVILKENDGWTTDQARVYGAALNIQEGGGDTDDYATFFRETRERMSRDDADAQGLLRRNNARTGYAIGALGSDNVFYGFLNGELPAQKAAAIANAAPGDHAIQDMMLERKIPTPELETFAGYVMKMRNSGALNLDGVQLSLFADKDYSAMLAAMEKESKAASREAAELDKKAAGLESLLKAGKTLSTAELRKHGARAGDREGLKLEAEAIRAEAARWRNFFHHPDILAQVQERAGTAVGPAESFQQSGREQRAAAVELGAGGFAAVDHGEARARLDALEKMRPVEIQNELTAIEDIAALRSEAKNIYDHLPPAVNVRDNRRLNFPSSGFGKIKSHSADPRIMQAVPSLGDVFGQAVHLYREGTRDANDFVVAWHNYGAKVQVRGRESIIRLTAKELRNGELELDFYDIHYTDTKKDDPDPSVREANPPRKDTESSTKDTVQHWIDFVKSLPGDADPEVFQQPAYHGTPHRFDKFSMSNMGGGTSVQSKGWGLYFSDSQKEADDYRYSYSGALINGVPEQIAMKDIPDYRVRIKAEYIVNDIAFGRATLQEEIDSAKRKLEWAEGVEAETYKGLVEYLNSLHTATIEENTGQLYRVSIPDNTVLLDFNKPLDEQPDIVRDAIGKLSSEYSINESDLDGERFYYELSEKLGGDKAASMALNALGVKGNRHYAFGINALSKSEVPNYVIFDDNAIEILETYYQGKRGSNRGKVELYRADAEHRQAAVIRVMKGGDMSTVLHEIAHIFLADMRDYVAAGNADIDTVRDYGKLLRAAGDLQIEDNVEQVARWFEEYLREGRAPSVELVKPFGLFSKWLSRVYSNIREYVGAEMDPETRGVFDRWLASEREIAEAEAYYGGLRNADFLNLIDDDEKRQELEEKLGQTRQRIINRRAGEAAKAWVGENANRGGLAEEARREVGELPVYRAIEAAKKAGLDRAAAEKTVGKAAILKIIDAHGDVFAKDVKPIEIKNVLRKAGYHEKDPIAAFVKELSEAAPVEEAVRERGSQGRRTRYYEALDIIAKAGGIDPDLLSDVDSDVMAGLERHPALFRPDGRENMDRIAMAAGFKTPSAMLDAMAKAQDIEVVVKRLAERKVRAKAKQARAWAEESIAGVRDDTEPAGQSAMHDPDEDIAAEGIETQRKALQQVVEARTRRRRSYVGRRAMEDKARQDLQSMPLRKAMDYNNHAKAERYWSGRAAEAMANAAKATDAADRAAATDAALEALDKQQKFHALSTEAFRIRRDFTDFMRRYGQRMAQSELASVENEYRDAVRDILVWSGVVVDKSGRFAPKNSDPDRLILPAPIRDEFDEVKNPDGTSSIDPSAEAFAPSMETLVPEWIRFKKLPRGYMGNILDLTPAMMTDIDSSIKNLIKYGRAELTALRDKDNQSVADLRDKLMATLATLPDRKRPGDDRKRFDRLLAAWDDYLYGNLSIDALAAEADAFAMHQGKGMGLMQTLIDKIRAGEVKQRERLETYNENTAEDFRVLDAMVDRLKRENGGTFFNPDNVRSPAELTGGRSAYTEWDPDMLLALLFNAGNRGNLYALQKGFGLTDGELDAIFSMATEQEWRAVQHAAQEMGALFDHMDAVHYRMTNRHLERVQPEPLTVLTADGMTLELDGWYYPLVFDPKLNDRAAKNAEATEYHAVMEAIFNPQKLRDGFTHSRRVDEEGNPVVTYPPLLKTVVIARHMTAATRWITLAEPLMEFRRVTMDPDFKKLFIDKLGAERYRDLRMWTNRMARPDKGAEEGFNKVLRKLRNASTVAMLGFNLRSAVRQLSSGGLAADEMSKAGGSGTTGWYWMVRGLRRMGARGSVSKLLSPFGFRSEATEEMFRLSPEAKHRANDVNKDISETLSRFNPMSGKVSRGWNKVRNALFHFTIAVDHFVSGAAFWGAYEQAASGNAGFDVLFDRDGNLDAESLDKVVRYANRIVRTQQSPYQADYTRLQADNGAVSLLTQFMGGLTPYLNSTYVNVQLARRLGWKHAMPLSTHFINAYILPSVALTMLLQEFRNMLSGGGDDEEENALAWELAEEISGQMVGALPGVREGVRFGMRRIKTGRPDWSSLVPPTISWPARVGDRVISAGESMIDGEAYAAGKDMGMAAAEVLGVAAPVRQIRPLAEEWGLVEE